MKAPDKQDDLRFLVSSTRQDSKGDLILELEEKESENHNNQMVKIRWGVPYVEPILTQEELRLPDKESLINNDTSCVNRTVVVPHKVDGQEKSAKLILLNAEADVVIKETEDDTMEEDIIEETECRLIEFGQSTSSNGPNTKLGAGYSNTPDLGYSNTPDPGYINTPDLGCSNTPDSGYSNTADLGYSSTPDQGYNNIPDPIMSESIWRCPEEGCYLQFESKQRGKYRKHYERIHLQIKPFACQHCNFRFYEKSDLKRHIESVHSKVKIICPVDGCNTLTTRIDLHISKQHPAQKSKPNKPNQKELAGPKCDICDQVFNRMYDVNRHKNSVHFGRKSFQCAECKRGFTDRRDLVRHNSAIHQSVKQVNKVFSCQHCKASYKRKKDLVQHLISNPHDGPST